MDRELVGIDEEAENAHILEAAKKLWGDLNHRDILNKLDIIMRCEYV